jgi:hypothetical protein
MDDRDESGLSIYWLPDIEPVKLKTEHEVVKPESYQERLRLESYESKGVESFPLVNRPFLEVLEEHCKLIASSRIQAEHLLEDRWYFGPYVVIGDFLVDSKPIASGARVIKSKRDAKLRVLQIRANFNGDTGICKIIPKA